MIIAPAIDLKDGKVVRLWRGQFEKVTEYSGDAVAVAKKWVLTGAQLLHVIDLDGAQLGAMQNLEVITRITQAVSIPVQVGGGIRAQRDIENLFKANVARVILGTQAVENRKFLKELLNLWRDRIAVSVDCINGLVTQKGWTSITELKATDFVEELEGLGLNYLIYTDIARDGTLQGPNLEGLKKVLDAVEMKVFASGGVSSLEDIKQLLKYEPYGLEGIIVGKAIYENKLDLKQAIKVCSRKE